ncbi:hypothetical protein [Actinokineospora bangkokensis]|uniref:Uncharacterized protein n=1 Tax=Actinokineospora bangkokensis TaxID=1193682 RepID=A0A1Q9LT47_9PSEU|nr:hypothetical protein [Actinokineospora bangkokensis]OLR95190.1 hypothetical protein BJP25_07805 [Actinokineospora bangkokensis]
MTSTEVSELQRTIGQLRLCVASLRSRYGDTPAVRRLDNDVERIGIDACDLSAAPVAPAPRGPVELDVVHIPDTPYDPALWHGADDEGVGGYQR